MLNTIESIFNSGVEAIYVEGEEGIGKTTLLAQYAKRYPDQTFSLFIKPTSRLGYDPIILQRSLCNQLNWALKKEEIAENDTADIGKIHTLIYELRRRHKRSSTPFYFIVDGIEGIPVADMRVKDYIIDMLPIGLQGFHYLFSCDFEKCADSCIG